MCWVRSLLALACVSAVLGVRSCYWNSHCDVGLFATKTPYDSVRGDIRDWPLLEGCEVVSLWALIRHGNRNAGTGVTVAMRELQERIQDEIIRNFDYEMGTSQLCSQDIEHFRKWTWNATMDTSASYLTGTGYEEIYEMARRIKEKYPQLLISDAGERFSFRPTNTQRTIVSSVAFVQALKEGTELNLTVDAPRERDDMLRPYDNCDRYQEQVKGGQLLKDQLEAFYKTTEFLAVQKAVQRRLGVATPLSADDVFTVYELCRFHRSWAPDLKSPWCAAFRDEDLPVLEYRDDVRHYYRNGYGSQINAYLGKPVLKDLYESLEAAVRGEGKNIVAYFAHDTLLDMVYCALGLYEDAAPVTAQCRDPARHWRTTYIAPFSANIMVFLNRCQDSGSNTYKVQIFNNEKTTPLCPLEGCTWEQFVSTFKSFTNDSLDFCSLLNDLPEPDSLPGAAAETRLMMSLLFLMLSLLILQR